MIYKFVKVTHAPCARSRDDHEARRVLRDDPLLTQITDLFHRYCLLPRQSFARHTALRLGAAKRHLASLAIMAFGAFIAFATFGGWLVHQWAEAREQK